MAIELLRSWALGDATAARDILAVGALRSVSTILSRLTFLGELGYSLELLLGAATAVLGAIGVFRCFGRKAGNVDAAPINEQYKLSNDDRRASVRNPWEPAEVTVRLENGFLRSLHRHRCVVTIHEPPGSAEKTEREAWYARDNR